MATLIAGVDRFPRSVRPVVTIGNFDGVHLGHRALIEAAKSKAAELSFPSVVMTFDPAPVAVLRPELAPPRIQTLDDRLESLAALGVDYVVVQPFDRSFASCEPAQFADEVLVGGLNAGALVLGYDFRFGRNRAGNAAFLSEYLSVDTEQVEAFELEDGPVSSSRIRRAIGAGELELAQRLLGRPHEVIGHVVKGDQRGRTLGFPTANIEAWTELLPGQGVYAVEAVVEDEVMAAVANLGSRPTFDGMSVKLEVHLLDRTLDLYDKPMRVRFRARIRDEQRFPSAEALKAQIGSDVEAARALL